MLAPSMLTSSTNHPISMDQVKAILVSIAR